MRDFLDDLFCVSDPRMPLGPPRIAHQNVEVGGVDERIDALLAHHEKALHSSSPSPLRSTDAVPRESGVYVLHYAGTLVYIGAANILRQRLTEHRRSVMSASACDIDQAFYRYVRTKEHIALSLEKLLIQFYSPAWNSTGFGSKTNGNGRRHQKKSVWDQNFGREVRR